MPDHYKNGKKKKKKSREVKPYSSYGKRKPTSTRRSRKRGMGSKRYASNKAKARAKAKANIARMMGESRPHSSENKFKHERNKKIKKPELKSRYQ